MISRKVAVIIGLAIGFSAATIWWLFPEAVGVYVIAPATAGALWLYTWFLYAPVHVLVGAGVVAFIAIVGHRIWVALKNIGRRSTREDLAQAGFINTPSYSPQQPVPIPASSVPAVPLVQPPQLPEVKPTQ